MMNSLNIARERAVSSSTVENQLYTRQRELAKLEEQLTTGKRVNRASDDASAYAQSRKLEVLDERYSQHTRAIDAARLWVNQTEHALDEMGELFMQAREHATRALSDTYSQEERNIEADYLETLLTQMVDLMNSKSGDEYLFAGSRTTVAPFDPTGVAVVYNGNDAQRQRRVGLETAMSINVTGSDLHDTGAGFTITDAMQRMIDGMRAGDRDEMEAAMGEIRTAHEHVQSLTSRTGAVGNRLSLVQAQIDEAQMMLRSRASEIRDIDVAEAILRYQKEQTGLQATLKVTASLMQTTLLDYLP